MGVRYTAEVSFLEKSPRYETEKPYLVLLPEGAAVDPSIPLHNLKFEEKEVSVLDIRDCQNAYHLEECGFEYLAHATAVTAILGDEPTIDDVTAYKAETEAVLCERFGAVKVVCYELRLRERKDFVRDAFDINDPLLVEGPALGAHTDVTARSGPEMIQNRLAKDLFDQYRTPEYQFCIVNTWRSRNDICQDNPLAVCDYRTVNAETDLIACDRVIPERAGEVYYIHQNDNHQWCFLKNQTKDELLLMLMYDEDAGERAKYLFEVRNSWSGPTLRRKGVVWLWVLGDANVSSNVVSLPKKSVTSVSKWESLEKILDDLRRSFARLNVHIGRVNRSESGRSEHRELIGQEIYQVFTLLIDFWIEAVRRFESAGKCPQNSPRGQRCDNEHADTCEMLPDLSPKLSAEQCEPYNLLRTQIHASIKTLKDLTEPQRMLSASAYQEGALERRAGMVSSPSGLGGNDYEEISFPVSVLPYAHTNAVFYGRDNVLASMSEFFDTDETSTSLLSVLLQGTGGVGKTQTALHFAHKSQSIGRYDVVLWIASETPLSLTASMTEIAKRLSFPDSDSPGSDESNLRNFLKWMNRQARQKKRCLLIYDNVEIMDDNLTRYIPTTPCNMIITSRNQQAVYEGTKRISMKPFSAADGGCLLRELLQFPEIQLKTQEDIDAATYLAKSVEGLPLGIRLLAGLINQRDGESTSSFMEEYKQYPRHTMVGAPRVFGYDKDKDRKLDGDEHPLDRVWTMSFKSLTRTRLTLMGVASFLSPDSITRKLFGPVALNELPGTLEHLTEVCGPSFKYNRHFNALVDVALLERNSDQGFSIHRLIQDAFRYSCNKDEALQHFTAALHIVHQFFPRQINGRPMHAYWDKCRDLIQHGQMLATRFEELQERFPGEMEPPLELLELVKSCGWYLYEMADHPVAIALLDTVLKTVPESLRKTEVYAHMVNTIACCTFELSDLARCRRELDKALVIREAWARKKAPGAEEELANTLNNFGNLESAEGKYESALAYFSKARKIRSKLGEGAIVPMGVTYMTTGRALFLQGNYKEAVAEYKNAEKIFLDKFGKDAHFMAHLNYAYGNLELARGDIQAAKGFYAEARRILEKGTPLHLLLAACYYKIANLAEREGNRDEALKLLDKGLGIAEFREGKGDAARIIMKKALILSKGSAEEMAEASSLRVQVQEIVMEHFPNTVYVLENEDSDEGEWDAWICPYWR
ncbi:hypothetical protein QBC39DRAFT_390506 [Podospora conica]|nr:hypothetical protein QBC39DRAFT_390506 [Schizothecium conicum]